MDQLRDITRVKKRHSLLANLTRISKQRWSRGHKARGQGHKKVRGQGQGQPFRGQALSRPRTGMLEAKAKDQGHRLKRSQKKNGFQKFFSGDLQFIGVPRIFDWGVLNYKSHDMTSSKFYQRGSTCGTKIS